MVARAALVRLRRYSGPPPAQLPRRREIHRIAERVQHADAVARRNLHDVIEAVADCRGIEGPAWRLEGGVVGVAGVGAGGALSELPPHAESDSEPKARGPSWRWGRRSPVCLLRVTRACRDVGEMQVRTGIVVVRFRW